MNPQLNKPNNVKVVFLTASALTIICGAFVTLFFSQKINRLFVQPQKTISEAKLQGPSFGELVSINGFVEVETSSATKLQLRTNKPIKIFSGLRLRTGKSSLAQLQFTNQYTIRIDELSEVVIQLQKPQDSKSAIFLNFSKGGFSLLNTGPPQGLIALKNFRRLNPSNTSSNVELEVAENTPYTVTESVRSHPPVTTAPMPTVETPPQGKSLTNEQIRSKILEQMEHLQRCQFNALRDQLSIKGGVVVGFSILPEGKTENVEIVRSSTQNRNLNNCIKSVFERVTFSTFSGRPIVINYPLDFE